MLGAGLKGVRMHSAMSRYVGSVICNEVTTYRGRCAEQYGASKRISRLGTEAISGVHFGGDDRQFEYANNE